MAVGYQYQSDYDKKETKSGFKKKLIILGTGIAVLIIVAIAGAPKKTSPQGSIETGEFFESSGSSLSESLQKSKGSSDKFIKNTLDGVSSDDMLYNQVNVKYPLNVNREKLDLSNYSCQYSKFMDYFDVFNSMPIFSYKCTSVSEVKFLMVATINTEDDKIVNWKLNDSEDLKVMTLFLSGWKGL